MLTLYAYMGAQVPPPQPIDYSPQLQKVLEYLQKVIGEVQTHDANTGQTHNQIISKLETLLELGGAYLILAQQSKATQEQIKGIISQIAESMTEIRGAIADFQSAAMDAISSLGDLIQREFDQTQASIESLRQTVADLLSPKEQEWVEKRTTVASGETAKKIIVPAGTNEICAYALHEPFEFVVNGQIYAAGEQYLHDWASSGNTWMTYKQTVFEIPAGKKFQVSYKARRDLGPIEVIDLATGTIENPALDTQIEVPEVLEEVPTTTFKRTRG